MSEIIRGTTPTNRFRLPEELHGIRFALVRITYEQGGRVLINRELENCLPTDGRIEVTLTQEETLALRDERDVEVQVKFKTLAGTEETVFASKIQRIPVGKSLSEELM